MLGVTHSPGVLSWNFGISKIPIEFHVTQKPPLRQETVKKVAKVIIVGFVFEGERACYNPGHLALFSPLFSAFLSTFLTVMYL